MGTVKGTTCCDEDAHVEVHASCADRPQWRRFCGHNSGAESQPSKLLVVGSNPTARSRRGTRGAKDKDCMKDTSQAATPIECVQKGGDPNKTVVWACGSCKTARESRDAVARVITPW